jgi:hypothetical protein
MADEVVDLQTGDTPIRLRLGEQGYTGLRICNDQIHEEARRVLRWPEAVKTYTEMASDATIASALALFEMMISRVKWKVMPPEGASEETKKRTQFLNQCMGDMEHSWFTFIKEVTSCFTYGFSVHEKVYRKRYRRNGSRYNDGLIGWKKLPIRAQTTIAGWMYSDDGRDLLGVKQCLSLMPDIGRFSKEYIGSEVVIPRNKVMLFRTDVKRDNPEGNSPLKSVYISYRYMQELKEQEAIGVTRDLGGMPVLSIPPRYMSADASPEEASIYEYYKRVIRNIQNNEQTGLILPQMFDPESRQPLFDFKLMGTTGGKSYDINAIISRYVNEILQALFADVLKLGQSSVGSYSLADSKTSILAMAMEARLREIQDVLNNDLIVQTYRVNGWDTAEELPYFQYGDLDEVDTEAFSKAIQRCAATATITRTPKNINRIHEVLGLPDRVPEDMSQDKLNELLGHETSRSGDGMVKGAGNGTSDQVSQDDNSVANTENS